MAFTEHFQSFVCAGDCIACEQHGFRIVARIVRDDCPDAPDQRQEGFWPSLYKGAPGFIGPGPNHRQRFADARAKAEAIMESWRKNEWFYCGIVLSVSFDGVELDSHAASIFGIETNHPGGDNAYLSEVADALLPEALSAGRAILARLTGRAAASP